MNIPILLLAIFLSSIPIVFWMMILWRKHRKNMLFFFVVTFLLTMIFSAVFHHQLEFRIENWITNAEFKTFRIFLIYMGLGILIEYGKNFIVRLTGGKYFRDVDDVMDLSFATALGFVFYQHIFYFYGLFQGWYPDIIGPVKIFKEILKSEFYVLPIHLFCSGMFGYFYGISLLATEKLKQQYREKSRLYRILPFKTITIIKGTLISVFFYGIFFTMLKFDPTIGDVNEALGIGRLVILGTEIDEKILPIFSFFFFGAGTVLLFQLMDDKRQWAKDGLFVDKTPKEAGVITDAG